ncbi:hypothetical protein OROGR_018202 [Orobanche gracilis]
MNDDSSSQPPPQTHGEKNNNNRGKGNYNNRGRNYGRGGGQPSSPLPAAAQPAPPSWPYPTWPGWPYQQWALPPCPYPTSAWVQRAPRPSRPNNPSGLLGPHPRLHQAYAMQAPSSGYAPTDIEAAMHTLSLHEPDENWYMDTGATSHMTANSGTFTSYLNLSKHTGIIVGNGSTIPI